MNFNLPLPQRAAVLAAQALRESGFEIPLSVIQEAIARSRGHKSFQTCLAAVEAAAATNSKEGLELWAITGREYGDDDDSMSHVWAKNGDEATDAFIRETLGLTPSGDEEPSQGHPAYYIVDSDCLGTMRNGVFEMSPWLLS